MKRVAVTLFLLVIGGVFAQGEAVAALTVSVDTLWVLVAAALVFFMQAGFALVEAGLQSAKNVVNILMKNYLNFIIASLAFWALGFGFMFADGNGILGLGGWFVSGADSSPLTGGMWGTMSLGLFGLSSLGASNGLFYGGGFGPLLVQALGTALISLVAFGSNFILWSSLKAVLRIRVSAEEEITGLDVAEHGTAAYASGDTLRDPVLVSQAAGD